MSDPVPRRPDVAEPGAAWDPPGPPPQDDGIRPVSWAWWEVLLVGLIGFVTGSIVILPLLIATDQDPTEPVGTTGLLLNAVFYAVWAGVFLAWLAWFHRGWRVALGRVTRERALREVVTGGALGVVLYLAASILGFAITAVLSAVSGEPVGEPVQVQTPSDPGGALVLIGMAVLLAAAVEEFIFRGLLFRSIADRYGFWPGALTSAFLFGLIHTAVGSDLAVWTLRVTLVSVGIGLAWIYRSRRNLLAAISAHAAFNAVGVTLILLAGGR